MDNHEIANKLEQVRRLQAQYDEFLREIVKESRWRKNTYFMYDLDRTLHLRKDALMSEEASLQTELKKVVKE